MASVAVRLLLPALAALVIPHPCLGQSNSHVRFEISIHHLPPDLNVSEQVIRENILVAAEMWTSRLVTKPSSIEIELKFQAWPARGAGRSLTAVRLDREKVNGKTLLEEGMPHELRTGNDPNGTTPDVEIILDPEYAKTIWWDPQPRTRQQPMPAKKLDGVSIMAHELGHALGFNGRIDPKTGQIKSGEISTYDRWVEFDGKNFFFTGPAATKAFQKKIPLSRTLTNYHHFGEPGPGLDPKLNDALMHGIFMQYGKRYVVTELDLAVLSDCGLEIKK